jgi:signal transduction histidine kinase
MSADRSFRWRLLVGSTVWTVGALLIASAFLVVFLGAHPRTHAVILDWFVTVPAALVALTGLACMAAGALQIRRGLSAVDELRARLAAVRRGDAQQLPGDYPAEVQPLVDDLNALLADRANRVAKAAEAAGDLAHGLKTPLAILARDAERAAASGDRALGDSLMSQVDRMRRQIDYHLAGARAAAAAHTPGVTCALAATVQRLMRALDRLHADRSLRLEQAIDADHVVRCAPEDVEEMLGNLLDNACTWAHTTVRVSSAREQDTVMLCIDDDGPGLSPEMAARVLERGVRADERVPGSGLGLAIVRHLADVYGGSLVIERAPLGGLRVRLTLPNSPPTGAALPSPA